MCGYRGAYDLTQVVVPTDDPIARAFHRTVLWESLEMTTVLCGGTMSRTLGWFGLPFLNDIRLQHLETRWHNAMGLHPGLWVWSPVVQTYQSHGSQDYSNY